MTVEGNEPTTEFNTWNTAMVNVAKNARLSLRMSTIWDQASGVTAMCSDRGPPTPMGQNGGPQAQAVEQKHWPGRSLIYYNVVFWPSELCKISPQTPGNGIQEILDSKISAWACPGPPRKLVHIRRSIHAFATSTRGPSKILNQGPPDITLRHWIKP
jgi:hypothetical protein